ncbi:extensin-like [Homalodisca vitripennis]|uniref:extensin-like n=1 Tax=Homalodisca vitripennis TaxID=197043 RepID=UPI001EEC7DF7|nr:extensin-like [Homalodisca vitripennis]
MAPAIATVSSAACASYRNEKQLSYAAAAKKVQTPAPSRIEPPKPQEAPAPAPPATVDNTAEPPTENREEDDFEVVRRRRHRPARRPENRGARPRSTPKTSTETRQPPVTQQPNNSTVEDTPAPARPARPALPRPTPRPRDEPPKPASSTELQAQPPTKNNTPTPQPAARLPEDLKAGIVSFSPR